MTAVLRFDRRVWVIAAGVFCGILPVLPLRVNLALVSLLLGAAVLWWLLRAPDRWIGAFLVSALVLPPLPIELGNSGPHVCLLAALVGLLAGSSTRWRIPTGALTRAFLFLFFVLFGSTSMAALVSGPVIAAGSLVRVMLLGISIYLFFQVRSAGPNPRQETILMRVLFIAGTVSALFACLDFYFHFPAPAAFAPQFVWLSSGVFRRAQGVFYEASTLGNVCAFFLTMVIVALSRGKSGSPVPRPLLVGGGVLFATAMILSYSRASVVNVAVSTAALLFLLRGRFRWTWFVPMAAGFGLIVAFAITRFFPTLSNVYVERASSIANVLSSPEGVLSGRVGNWQFLLDFLRQHPGYALLGIGYKTIPYSGLFGSQVVSDNVYLGMLVEAGILGLAAVLWLNATILRYAYRAAVSADTASDPWRTFAGAWIFCFWAGQSVQMLSGDLLTYWRVLPLYFWVLAIATRTLYEDPDRRSV
jgi:O-antigen ligase